MEQQVLTHGDIPTIAAAVADILRAASQPQAAPGKNPDEPVTIAEICNEFKISKQTFHRKKKLGIFDNCTRFGQRNRGFVRYKRGEIAAALTQLFPKN